MLAHASAVRSAYPEALHALFDLGPVRNDDEPWREEPFADYAALGVRPEHVPELIRLAIDRAAAQHVADKCCWAPVHACRALGALADPRAIEPLIELMRRLDRANEDFWLEDMPGVFARLGGAAVRPLFRAARDARTGFGARLFLLDALERIGLRDQSQRATVVAGLVDMLKYARLADPGINGHVIGALIELGAVETMPAIRAVYEGGWVDETVCGRIEAVETDITLTPAQRRDRQISDLDEYLKAEGLIEDFDDDAEISEADARGHDAPNARRQG